MTREEAVKELKETQESNDDPDTAHRRADCVLCSLLTSLGYEDVVEVYNAVEPKWYA